MSKRDIGKEILAGLDEIAAWKRGELKLKTTRVTLPKAVARALLLIADRKPRAFLEAVRLARRERRAPASGKSG